MPKVDGRDIVTGAHKYTYDMKRPGMLYGKVLRPPSFGATLASLDSAAAEAMPRREGRARRRLRRRGGARRGSRREQALAALKAEWKHAEPREACPSTKTCYRRTLQAGRRRESDRPRRLDGT